MFEFKKDEKGNELATITKSELETYTKQVKEETINSLKKDSESNKGNFPWEKLNETQKELKQLRKEMLYSKFENEFIGSGGRKEYVKDAYNNFTFDKDKDVKELMVDFKKNKPIYFNQNQSVFGSKFINNMGIGTNGSDEIVVNDGGGRNLREMLRNKK